MALVPAALLFSPGGMVATPDHLASQAGVEMLAAGGSAADAAIAASAVLAVTSQHMCGLGGDLWALVHSQDRAAPAALVAAGRAGSGADPTRLAGLASPPPQGDPAAIPVPGCVDGWVALHERYGRLALSECLAAAIRYAEGGFPASASLASALGGVAQLMAPAGFVPPSPPLPGALVRRPALAETLAAIAASGRDAFYLGPFGEGLLGLGGGEYQRGDLERNQASWEEPLATQAWGATIWGAPAPSQSYCLLSAAWIASHLDLPGDPDDPRWAHLLVEAIVQSCADRGDVLFDGADAAALCAPSRLEQRLARVKRERASLTGYDHHDGDTVACVVMGPGGEAVSMLQSNASGFGSNLVEERSGVFLHNRGMGFTLQEGHPARYGPARRPPSTLSPTIAQAPDGRLISVATMGGDSQPQILLQLLARVLQAGQGPAEAISAGRWSLLSPASQRPAGFSTWEAGAERRLGVEANAPAAWARGLGAMGHRVVRSEPFSFGHAQMAAWKDGVCEGMADPRSGYGGVAAR